jgi:hypothetical protein
MISSTLPAAHGAAELADGLAGNVYAAEPLSVVGRRANDTQRVLL